ncbi:MAG: ABC transporter ATP-binding protein [Actinobacteria bacterium]|nr:ABC transporter ATP-binding protein [Actinomycetota bacterium]MCL6088314.1 ABC transporter ATP-binding protein [Actinomycetota bacterium]
MDNYIISTKNLTKKYGEKVVVDDLNLSIPKGEIYGLLGPNGAGKSTVILMLLGLTEPSSGQLSVQDFNPVKDPLRIKRFTGYLPEKVGFYEDMTSAQNLEYTALLNSIPEKDIPKKIDEVLSIVGLTKDKNRIVKQFSKGMKQRLGIADVLIKDPELVIFDEPTEGLDIEVANQILETISELNKKKKITFLISSHQLNLVQKICHRVGIMSKGKLIGEGNVSDLSKNIFGGYKHQIELEVIGDAEKVVQQIKTIKGIKSVISTENVIHIGTDEDLRQEISRMVTNIEGVILTKMDIKDFSLEDVYLNYFKEV